MRGGRHLSRFSPPARDWNDVTKLVMAQSNGPARIRPARARRGISVNEFALPD